MLWWFFEFKMYSTILSPTWNITWSSDFFVDFLQWSTLDLLEFGIEPGCHSQTRSWEPGWHVALSDEIILQNLDHIWSFQGIILKFKTYHKLLFFWPIQFSSNALNQILTEILSILLHFFYNCFKNVAFNEEIMIMFGLKVFFSNNNRKKIQQCLDPLKLTTKPFHWVRSEESNGFLCRCWIAINFIS